MRHIQSFRSVSVSWFAAAALAGWAGCGFNSGSSGNNGKIDASVGQDADAMGPPIDGFDGTCYGPAGWQACFASASPPSGNFMLPGTINTNGGNPCLNAQPMGWAAPQPAACFIVADTITVPGNTNVNGSKPLVLVAKSSITVAGALDVASHRGDVGTQPSECQAASQDPDPPDASRSGGGGAGGSFRTRAGNGGSGDGGGQNGQSVSADTLALDHLRGGCLGQAGGALAPGDAGKVGLGGGSVYLISGGEIVLQNSINASGAGGAGGNKRAGGSGGGSGGMIVLYAATITVIIPLSPAPAPVLMANGGGGGGGGQNNRGGDGSDPIVTLPLLPASGGGPNGGKGYSVTNPTDVDGAVGPTGTGGGGGGGGAGYIRSNKSLTGAMVSPMVDMIP